MGLDISAHSKIKVIKFEWPDEDNWDAHSDYINPHFPHAVPAEWLEHDAVHWAETPFSKDISFRAGPYSGYGLWRGMLSEFSFGVDTYSNDVWDSMEGYSDKPFWEVINFSDAEGCFYGPVCAKLYQDFVSHRQGFLDFLDEKDAHLAWNTDYYPDLYDNWTTAFHYASNDGIVSFH